jgi:predicted dehydrogenase
LISTPVTTINGLFHGLSGFIGPQWAAAAGMVMSPRLRRKHCVPGRPENLGENARKAAALGFPYSYGTLEEALADSFAQHRLGIIALPNHLHEDSALMMLNAGMHVACDKPLAHTRDSALRMAQSAKTFLSGGTRTAVLPTYCTFPALLEAEHRIACDRHRILGGRFTYDQGWLKKPLAQMSPGSGGKQAEWRKDAMLSGAGGALGDIFSHIVFQLWFLTGQKVVAVKRANRRFVVDGKLVKKPGGSEVVGTDDECFAILVLEHGAEIHCHAVQYADSKRNDNGWQLWTDGPTYQWNMDHHPEILRIGDRQIAGDAFAAPIIGATRTMPAFHGQGWTEAAARMLQWFAWEITNEYPQGVRPFPFDFLLGLNVQHVIEAVIESAESDGKDTDVRWINGWDDLPL